MRCQRRPPADPRSTLPRRARSLYENRLGPDGARALAPALEKMVGLKELVVDNGLEATFRAMVGSGCKVR